MQYLGIFLDYRIIKKKDTELENFSAYNCKVLHMNHYLEDYLRIFMEQSPSMRKFMLLHSVFTFSIDFPISRSTAFFRRYLQPTAQEIGQFVHPTPPPKEIMDMIAVFDPEPVFAELHGYIVKYDDNREPIRIIDPDFEEAAKIIPEELVKDFISAYDVIAL